jgi:hypothetical protein
MQAGGCGAKHNDAYVSLAVFRRLIAIGARASSSAADDPRVIVKSQKQSRFAKGAENFLGVYGKISSIRRAVFSAAVSLR